MKALGIVSLLALATTSSAAVAQETGTLITKRPATVDGTSKAATRRTMQQFAVCTMSRSSGRVEVALNAPLGPAYSRLMSDLADAECLGGDAVLRIPPDVLRGTLFEAAYDKKFGRSGPTDFAAVPPINYLAGYSEALSSDYANTIALAQFGDCVARADGVNARKMMTTDPEMAAESAVIAALAPKFAACIPQGRTIRFSRSVARGAIAEGLYRLSRAAEEQPR